MSTQQKIQIVKTIPRDVRKFSRSKASHSKTRTGCARCKKRRIKCDESRPGCQRCYRAGEPCPGYPSLQVRLFGLSMDSGFTSELDKKCFDSFISEGARQLSCFQPISQNFWTVLLPQLSQIHLSIKHSVIALSLINEPLSNSVVGKIAHSHRADLLSKIMAHYNDAIRGFATSVHNMNIEAKVASCFVFTALSIYLDRTCASKTHILAAYHFIQEHELRIQHGKTQRDREFMGTFIPVAKQLLIDACVFMNTAPLLSNYTIDPIAGWIDDFLTIPTFFPNFETAWACLGSLLKCTMVSTQNLLPFDQVARLRLRQALKNFRIAMQNSNLKFLCGRELPELQINTHVKGLFLHHHAITIMSQCHAEMRESEYQAFEEEFQMLFDQILDALEVDQYESWRIGMGYIPPLFFIATRCRSSRLRRQALELLHQTKRIERFWTSCMAYTLAKFVVDLEEASNQNLSEYSNIPHTFIRLERLRLDPAAQVVHVQFTVQTNDYDCPAIWAQVACPIDKALNQVIIDDLITVSVVRASGYSGITLCTGTIACVCVDDQPVGKATGLPDQVRLPDQPWLRTSIKQKQRKASVEEIAFYPVSSADKAEKVWLGA